MTEEVPASSSQPVTEPQTESAPTASEKPLEQREKDLSEQIARFEAQKAERDSLTEEIKAKTEELATKSEELKTKTAQVAKLDTEIKEKTQNMAALADKPSSAASGQTNATAGKKLEFFEGEVRKLEQQLTQQKVSYERQLKQLQEQLDSKQPEESSQQRQVTQLGSMQEIDRVADELNAEVSNLALDAVPQNYDWKVVSLLEEAEKLQGEQLERLLGEQGSSQEVSAARESLKKLDTRIHLCTTQLKKQLTDNGVPQAQAEPVVAEAADATPAVVSDLEKQLESKNEQILMLEKEIEKLNANRSQPVSDAEIENIEATIQKLAPITASTNSISLVELIHGTNEVIHTIVRRHSQALEDEAKREKVNKLIGLLAEHVDALKERIEASELQNTAQESEAQTASQQEIEKLKKRLATIETDLESKDKTLLEQETQMLALTDQVEGYQKMEEGLKKQVADFEEKELQVEQMKADMLKKLQERQDMLEEIESLKSQADEEILKLQELLTEADNQLRNVEQRIVPLEEENEAIHQRLKQNEALVQSVKQDFQQILNYKSDLEVLVEEQTQHLQSKNQRLYQLEEQRAHKDTEIENLDGQVRRQTALADENRKKLLQAEVKLRQLTQATLKDLRAKIKDKNAEIEVLKEMVKSANMQAKSKDIDVSRLQKKINRLQNGQDASSNYGGSRRGRDDGSVSSRQSRLGGQGVSPAGPQGLNNNLVGLDGAIQERDAELEQTNAYDYRGQPQQNLNNNSNFPPMTKTRQQEWEEAVELDRILEAERNAASKAQIQKKQENNFNEYMDRIQNPNLKNQSSGLVGVLGSASPSPYYNGASGSLPDLKQSKRESLEAELAAAESSSHAKTVGRRGRQGGNGSIGVSSGRGRF